jgi:tRNA(Ile)-lysidine synthase TilS/MesJ
LNFNWTQIGKSLESSVRKACYDYELLGHDTIAVALSGGKDSLSLLLMLAALKNRGFPNYNLHAIHVSGVFTCGAGVDVPYLQKFCDRLEVPLHIRTSTQELETLECYSCSRERRHLLFDVAKEVGAGSVAFGHHRDDNAQTLLMNLMQKGEFAGMLPKLHMHHYGITIIRPLIYVSEQEIIQFAEQEGFRRIMCRCPVGQNSMRIKVEGLLKEMDALNPHARNNLAQASLNYGSDKASLLPTKRVDCDPTRSRFDVTTFQKRA